MTKRSQEEIRALLEEYKAGLPDVNWDEYVPYMIESEATGEVERYGHLEKKRATWLPEEDRK